MKLYMKQKVFSWVDRYQIFDENQNIIYHAEGKFLSMHGKMKLIKKDQEIFSFSHRLFTLFNRTIDIYNQRGDHIGIFTKKFSFLTPKISVDIFNKDYDVKGEIFAHDFTILYHAEEVATVSKRWFTWGDTYEIDIKDDQDIDMIIALVIGIDTTVHNGRYDNNN